MAILEIKTHPDSVLRAKAKKIKKITPKIRELAEDMKETMAAKNGVGLAGPQIGALKRIIIVQTEKGPGVFVNPKVVKKTKAEDSMQEGCLSLPEVWLDIKRARGVEIEALDLSGKKIKAKANGFTARIFQHEINHLDGVLISDLV